jgi:photosynthetic reaction center cytochrome c subunit
MLGALARIAIAIVAFVAAAEVLVFAIGIFVQGDRPPVESEQHGFRGTGMVLLNHPHDLEELKAANQIPHSVPSAGDEGPKAGAVYRNLKVLGDVPIGEFTRLMVNMTQWVAKDKGCAACHNVNDFADDQLYTKVVARRMLEMVKHVNTEWTDHVAETGVTCYTCHRGQLVPPNVWFNEPFPPSAGGFAQKPAGQNHPAELVGTSALPFDPLTRFLEGKDSIRVQATHALPEKPGRYIKDAEATYALMMNFSQSLGVNCDFCHNTRAFFKWETSPPQRVTAWHGIRMVQALNDKFLGPLKDKFPANRLGPKGDGPKVFCATCHNGVSKPLFGISMAKNFPALRSAASVASDAVPEAPPIEAVPLSEAAPVAEAAEPAAASPEQEAPHAGETDDAKDAEADDAATEAAPAAPSGEDAPDASETDDAEDAEADDSAPAAEPAEAAPTAPSDAATPDAGEESSDAEEMKDENAAPESPPQQAAPKADDADDADEADDEGGEDAMPGDAPAPVPGTGAGGMP